MLQVKGLAVMRWTFGKQTPGPSRLHHMYAVIQESTDVQGQSVHSMVSVIKTDVATTHTY